MKTERDVTSRRRRDAISDGQRRLLESLTRTGRLRDGLQALLDSLGALTQGKTTAAVMRVNPERSVLLVAASHLPDALEAEVDAGIPIAPQGHPAGEAAFSGQAVSAPDLRESSGWRTEVAVDAGLLSCCSTPIVAPNGEVLGTLDLYGETPGDPATEDLEVVSALAQTASLVMDRFRVFQELRTRRTMLAALNKINTSLAAELDSDRILRRVVDETVALLDAKMGAFFYRPTAGDGEFEFHTVAVAGEAQSRFADQPQPGHTLLFRQILEGGRSQRFEDVTKDPRFGRTPPHLGLPGWHPKIRSFLAVPVMTRENKLLGLLLFGHPEPSHFGRWHEEVVAGIASQSALALDNAALYEEARERAAAMALADRRKDEFLAILGHELRNPLSAITASLDVLAEHLPRQEESRDLGAILRRQVRHMGRLVDDLLDLGRITRGEIPVRLRVQDVRVPVRRAIQGARSYAARSQVTIDLVLPEEPCWARVDEVRIEQVIGNLVHNAVKFAPDSEIAVRVACEPKEVVVVVEDSGLGIDPERLQDIFDLFTQIQVDAKGGLGLGLTLVKQLVKLHGGSVRARSEGRGQGARFEVRLPRTEAPEGGRVEPSDVTTPAATEPGGPRSLRVLLAEDQDDAAQAMVMLLERWGHRVERAATGQQALAMAKAQPPDVAILDIGMPDMDGWELARALRDEVSTRDVRIAALSGLGQEDDLDRSVAAGIDEHFVKPVDPPALQRWLDDES